MLLEERFFKLLKYSNKLERNSKYLENEDPEAFDVFLHFLVRIERNLHYSEKQEYINLAKDFMAIYEGIGKKLVQLEKDESLELVNFLKPSRPELGALLRRIYGSCDSFSPDPEIALSDEKELKDCAQVLLLTLQDK